MKRLAIKVLSMGLAALMLPCGALRGATQDAMKVKAQLAQESNASSQLLCRFGIKANGDRAIEIEEALLSREMPEARSASEDLASKTLDQIYQIPLAARSTLFKELAQGASWTSLAPEILAQVPLPLAVTLAGSSPLEIACSLPLATWGYTDFAQGRPWDSMPIPYDADPTDEALPANTGSVGAGFTRQHAQQGVVHRTDCMMEKKTNQYAYLNCFKPMMPSVYFGMPIVPRGPPRGRETKTPTGYASLKKAVSRYSPSIVRGRS